MRHINRDGPAAPAINPHKTPSAPKEETPFAEKLRQEEQQQAASGSPSSSSPRQPIIDETHSLLSTGSKSKRKSVPGNKQATQRPTADESRMRTVLAAFGDCSIKWNQDKKRRRALSGDDTQIQVDDADKEPEKEMAINWKFIFITVIALAVFHLGRMKGKQIALRGQLFSEEEKEEEEAWLKEDDAVAGDTVSASLAKPMLRSSNFDAIKEEVTADNIQNKNTTDSLHAPHHILHHAVFPPHLEHLSNLTIPYDSAAETPYFWDVHFSGESVAEAVFSMCHGLTLAAEFGLRQSNYNEEELQVFELDKSPYVNVDTTTPEGIARASRLGLAASHLAHIIVSPYFNPMASDIFSPASPGRMFAFFRHPVDRAIGMYYYLARASWDPMYNPSLAKMTIEQYATSRYIENNWLTRFLVKKPGGKLNHADLLLAKKILKFKCLVGLYDDMEASLSRFQRYFGWNDDAPEKAGEIAACRRTIVSHGDKVLSHPISTKDEWDTRTDRAIKFGSTAWNAIARQNMFDMELYEFAKRLYKSQGKDMFDIV